MAEYTAEELKAAARKALAAGDMASAEILARKAMALAGVPGAEVEPSAGGMGEAPKYAENGVPMNSAAKREIIDRAKQGRLDVSPEAAGRADAMNRFGSGGEGGTLKAFQSGAEDAITMGLADEIGAALTFGQPYAESLASERALAEMRQNEYPASSMAGTVLGALMLPGPKARAGLAGNVGAGAAAGIGYGGAYGFGSGEGNLLDRAANSAYAAGVGGLLGAALPVVGAAAGKGYRGVKNMLASRQAAGVLGKELGIDRSPARVLMNFASLDDPAASAAAVARAGPNGMLADSGQSLAGVLDSTMQRPGQAPRIANTRLADRAAGTMGKINAEMDRSMGAARGAKGIVTDIRVDSAPAIDAAYAKAYGDVIDYSSPAGRTLEGLQSRLPAKAVRIANELMKIDGKESAQILVQRRQRGPSVMSRLPDIRQWDYIKRALRQMAESGDGAGALGGQTTMGSRYLNLAREVRSALGQASSAYDEAMEVVIDPIQRVKAVKLGNTIFNRATTREEVADAIEGATAPELAAMREGARSQIDEILANVNAIVSDPLIEPRQARTALSLMTSPASRQKLKMLLGHDWPALSSALDEASAALGLRSAVATNSRTAARQETSEMIDQMRDPGDFRRGNLMKGGVKLLSTPLGASDARIARLKSADRAALADVLTRPGQGAKTLGLLAKALAAQNASPANAGSAVRSVLGRGLFGLLGPTSDDLGRRLPPPWRERQER